MTYDGIERTYRIHVPASLDKTTPAPLVIALHGGGATGRNMIELTQGGLNDLADRDNFIVVYPNAVHYNWNDGRNVSVYISHRDDVDDVGFISALIDRFADTMNIDLSRVYITGMSNGAIMTFRLACELSDKIAAAAPVDGSIAKNFYNRCLPTSPVPIMMINGENDPLLPWNGGAVHGGDPTYGEVVSVADSVDFWVHHDNCSLQPTTTWLPDNDPNDGTRAYFKVYSGGVDGAEVILVGIQGGGHTWPGGLQYLSEDKIGKTCRDFDANEMIWSFFKNQTRSIATTAGHTSRSNVKSDTLLGDYVQNEVSTATRCLHELGASERSKRLLRTDHFTSGIFWTYSSHDLKTSASRVRVPPP